ncbi:hypothetical protein Ga0100230_013455 [Opitutaceae bacterium TAV3]|nr:hypothetical protein Ga0100230_013455 [Opitutaceae bacterium TAV3]
MFGGEGVGAGCEFGNVEELRGDAGDRNVSGDEVLLEFLEAEAGEGGGAAVDKHDGKVVGKVDRNKNCPDRNVLAGG